MGRPSSAFTDILMAKLKLAVIVGSTRRESINRKLAGALIKLADEAFEATILQIDDLPLYDQDLEADFPPQASRLKGGIEAADAILIVTPEHNRAISAALKNAIDWASRPFGKNSWAGKFVAVTGTSAGAVGTAVAQQQLREIMTNLAGTVAGGQYFITFKDGLVDGNGAITDEKTRAFLQSFVDGMAKTARKLAG
jgi:chromate reductase